MNGKGPRVGYVVKRYPRFSETFIVNEILAHEAAGHSLELFSLYPPNDTHFQDAISGVRAPVTYLTAEGLRGPEFWSELERCSSALPGVWATLEQARGSEAREVFQAARLARLTRERGLDLLHAHFAGTTASVARMAARFAGIPFTLTAHAKDIFHEDVSAEDLNRKLAEAAAVITVSDFNVKYLRERFGAAAGKVRRLYNGVDLGRFAFAAPSARPPKIVAVGRLVAKKGFHVLVEACAKLTARGRDFGCEIIGAGEQESALRQQIAANDLQRVVRLTGPRPQAEIIQRMQGAAVMAAPCIVSDDGNRDGLPTVLLEAMALGTPCVSTDVTGIPEILRDEQTGLQVAQLDPKGLARACERLLVDADLRVRLARAARSLIESEFDIERNAACQWELFAECTGQTDMLPRSVA